MPGGYRGKLLELANAVEPDHAGRLSVEIINRQFRDAGGSYEEYGAAVKAAIAHGWITMHPSVHLMADTIVLSRRSEMVLENRSGQESNQ
jgi:hypothetical protein